MNRVVPITLLLFDDFVTKFAEEVIAVDYLLVRIFERIMGYERKALVRIFFLD